MGSMMAGTAAGATLRALLEAGLLARITLRDETATGYHAALYLSRSGHPYTIDSDGVTFRRKASR